MRKLIGCGTPRRLADELGLAFVMGNCGFVGIVMLIFLAATALNVLRMHNWLARGEDFLLFSKINASWRLFLRFLGPKFPSQRNFSG